MNCEYAFQRMIATIDQDLTERIEQIPASLLEAPAPFEARFRLDFAGEANEASHRISVPPGKQLVIESVRACLLSGPAFWPRGRVVLVVHVQSLSHDRVHCFRFKPPSVESSRPDPVVFRKTHFFADPGTQLELVFIRQAPEDACGAAISVLGTLVSVPR